MQSIYFELVGDVTVGITVTEQADGTLRFDLAVDESTGTIGDLNAIFLDIADETLLDGLSVTGTDVTGTAFKEDGVTKVDNFTNVNGEVVKELGKFDLGVQFGTQGMSQDDIQTTSFVLDHSSIDLTLDLFIGLDAALRLTSVGEIDGPREDSSKIGGTVDPIASAPVATADTMTISNNETFNTFEFTDPLDNFVFSLLENDTTDGAPYTGSVETVNGVALTDGLIAQGSNGGLLQVFSDGTLDFSANDEFDFLAVGETTTTSFEYGIEGGSTATLTVTVFGQSDGGGGGGGGGDGEGGGGGLGGPLLPPDDGTDPVVIDDPFMI